MALHLNNLESPSPNYELYQIWGDIGVILAEWFWRKSQKCKKFIDGQTDRWTPLTKSKQKKRDENLSIFIIF